MESAVELHVSSYGHSDIGLVRDRNEDAWAQELACHFYILADGIGGRQAGEVASQYAVSRMCELVSTRLSNLHEESHEDVQQLLLDALQQVNGEIHTLSHEHEFLRGMGTTLSALLLRGGRAYTIHIGDSRIYYLEECRETTSKRFNLMQVTHDHRADLSTNLLTQAVGLKSSLSPDCRLMPLISGSRFMLCTDGLSNHICDQELYTILACEEELRERCYRLIEHAKQAGSGDNITALLIDLI